jgi:hypothetical protein
MDKMRLAPCLLLLPALAFAGSAFDGTWKMLPESLRVSGKARAELIAAGAYSCATCNPSIERLKADGTDQPVSGHDDYDSLAVKVRDRRSVEMLYKLHGRLVRRDTRTLAPDGRTLQGSFTDYSGTLPAGASYTEKRVAAAPPGAHALSGSWLQTSLSDPSGAFGSVSYRMTEDTFGMQANGQGYEAKFDGREYPVTGEPGPTVVTVRRIDANTVHETRRRAGQVTEERLLTVSGDGKTLSITARDLRQAAVSTLVFARQ